MPTIQPQIHQHAKKQEILNACEKRQSTKAKVKMSQIPELFEKDSETSIIKMLYLIRVDILDE